MQPQAEAFRETLLRLGEAGAVQETPTSAHTAAEAAAALGIPVAAIVKSLVFTVTAPDGTTSPLLVLASGSNRVDLGLVADHLAGGSLAGDPLVGDSSHSSVAKADAAAVKAATGSSIGGVPPLGHPVPLRTLVDATLLDHAVLWAAAGSATAVFPIAPQRLVELSGGEVLRIC